MKKKIYVIASVLLMMLMVISFILYKTFYSAHRDISSEKAQLSIMASELQLNYAKDDVQSNKKYTDKVIEISGEITAIEESTIVLDNMVQVDFIDERKSEFILDELITVKGRCVGYDDLLEVVKIDQALIIAKKN